jgi:hypothetical protein
MVVLSALVLMSGSSLANDGVIVLNRSPIRELLVLPVWAWNCFEGSLLVLAVGSSVVVTCVAVVARRNVGEQAATGPVSVRQGYRVGRARMR